MPHRSVAFCLPPPAMSRDAFFGYTQEREFQHVRFSPLPLTSECKLPVRSARNSLLTAGLQMLHRTLPQSPRRSTAFFLHQRRRKIMRYNNLTYPSQTQTILRFLNHSGDVSISATNICANQTSALETIQRITETTFRACRRTLLMSRASAQTPTFQKMLPQLTHSSLGKYTPNPLHLTGT